MGWLLNAAKRATVVVPMRAALLIAVLLAALAAPTVQAARVPLPPTFAVHYAPCPTAPDALGCANPATGDVYLTDRSRFLRWHEIGHVFDHQVLTDPQRVWFTKLFRFPPGASWYQDDESYALGAASPSELFADAYAACALGLSPAGRKMRDGRIVVRWEDGYGYLPSARKHRMICNAISFIGIATGNAA